MRTHRPLLILISVFFFWGFVAAANSVLILVFRQKFDLTQAQSLYVDLAFYAAYFVGSLLYFLLSFATGDPLNRIGYKNGLVLGLLIAAIGALGFVPASGYQSFELMLSALFVMGLGFALLQIVANPYLIALGNPEKGPHRISLAGGVNSFATMIAPLLISFAIYGTIDEAQKKEIALNLNMAVLQQPYLILAIAFLLFAVLIAWSKLPAVTNSEKMERDLGAFRFPQLRLGMLAIFAYVGVEVSIAGNLQELIRQPYIAGLDKESSGHFLSLYWGSLMIGRWTQAVSVFRLTAAVRHLLTVLVPLAAFGVILAVNALMGSPLEDLYVYLPYILLLIVAFFIGREKPARTLWIFATAGLLLMVAGMLLDGRASMYAFIAGGLFCSIMWPCIFSLSIAGLGKYTNQGSSLLIMMILGGALIPVLQGTLADYTDIRFSYLIGAACFAYLLFYAVRVSTLLRRQGIDYDAQ